MCGLAAILAYAAGAPSVDETELLAIREAMLARGPDGDGLWVAPDQSVGLAHRRLAIIDLTNAAAQPMAFEEGRYRITYNGEIYNFKALKERLKTQGHVFKTQSDTEVLLHLYHRHGVEMVKELRGMFAFAIWDDAKHGMFLARDSFGIKPLYYADDGKTLRVASQVKALRAGGHAGVGVNAAGHVGFYLFGSVPEPHTLFADIKSLPAGHTLWVDRSGLQTPVSYFSLAEHLAKPSPHSLGGAYQEQETIEVMHDALYDSVAHHFVSDVPVGVFLSAGLDSTTLAAVAAEMNGANLETFTLGFEEFKGTPWDEVTLAADVAKTLGTRHHVHWISKADFSAEADHLLDAMDQPTIDGVNTYFVAKATHDLGLKVAISGLGGDELLGGYGETFGQIPKLVEGIGRIPGVRSVGQLFRALTAPFLKKGLSPKYAGALEYASRYSDAYLLHRGLFMPWELKHVLDADLVKTGLEELAPLSELENLCAPIAEPARKIAALEMTWYMRNQLLRDSDWAGMAHSLEIRVPLVDAVLFRRLAPQLLRAGGPTKQTMARSPSIPLPASVLNRPKTGFAIPIHDWLQADQPDVKTTHLNRGLRGWAQRVYQSAL